MRSRISTSSSTGSPSCERAWRRPQTPEASVKHRQSKSRGSEFPSRFTMSRLSAYIASLTLARVKSRTFSAGTTVGAPVEPLSSAATRTEGPSISTFANNRLDVATACDPAATSINPEATNFSASAALIPSEAESGRTDVATRPQKDHAVLVYCFACSLRGHRSKAPYDSRQPHGTRRWHAPRSV